MTESIATLIFLYLCFLRQAVAAITPINSPLLRASSQLLVDLLLHPAIFAFSLHRLFIS